MASRFKGSIKLDIRDSEADWDAFLDARAPKDAPNVLVILYDDTGQAAWSPYGGRIEMPTLDRLAKNGLTYSQWHTTAVCSPTRSCFLTGRNHHANGFGSISEAATGFPGYNGHIPLENGTIASILRDAGWSTFWIGKNHNVPVDAFGMGASKKRWPLGLGYDRFYGFDRLLDVATPLEAIGLERTAAFIADGAAAPVKLFTNEISDIVDALSVQANLVTGPGSVMGVFERRRRGRSVQSWGTQLPQGIMYAHSGADRLLLVRTALSIRTNACDGLGEWMSNYIQLAVPRGRRRALVNLEPDPLLLLALALPIHNFHQLSLRTSLWSRDLQDRWHNCAIAAAFSGFN